ncbi:DNA polymerase III subunit gamma/tau [Arcticibacter eurypsychrophilus]|uniref:DNA polymerase III subunit gamma/tau n=1 Tax=Arcticibacter eurypsychrophilus TaxID=1434752 RepID=UPI00084D2B5C|nr:DNA polymerase III subunit gamma/tau [Arcticibacter eurypsychrophilus]
MDNFLVSARKYRPTTFESVVGQLHITNTLKNAIKNNQLAQAFLFCGPRGVGKTTCARILAKTINCENLSAETEACGVCPSCRAFLNGNSFNVHELDAASNNSVDDIRSLTEQVRIPPQAGRYKIYIIDEVHMLSQAAFNAFLKTLEEPPPYAIFILATTEKHKILPTILSRCQIFDFNRIKVDDMAHHLAGIAKKENVTYDADGLHVIAQKADGGLRDALSMFDQIVSFSNRNITYKAVIDNLNILDYDYYFKVTDHLLNEDIASTLLVFDEILVNGFDGNNFITGLASHFRNLLVGRDTATLKLLEVSEGIRNRYMEQCKKTSASFLLSGLNIANQCDLNYRNSKNQRLQVEISLIKICHITSALNLANAAPEEVVKKKPNPVIGNSAVIPVQVPVKQPNPVVQTPPIPTNSALQTPSVPTIPTIQLPAAAVQVQNDSAPTSFQAALPVKPKILIKKMVNTGSLIPNLNDLATSMVAEEDNAPKYVSGDMKEHFSSEDLLIAWNKYAQDILKENKMSIYTLMHANEPVLKDNFQVEVIVDNRIQENLLVHEKVDLLNRLRVELQNFDIDLIVRYIEKNEKKQLYTSHDKYQHLVAKNPQLDDLRKRFNLDLS